ncbi:hypothetical protein ACJMK2_042274 [Sinanodonta woodiana]|uniref:Fibronectin type-III domain-containing protein n=1 Tax=Sinanodonta woodiana TaxID=1069815 RepID=A0ABD3W6V9_SINWO
MDIKNHFSLICIMVLLPVRVASGLYGKCGVKSTTTLMLLLFMLSCLTCALTPTNEDEVTFIECGDIVPVDPFFFIGERLVLTCTIWSIDNNKTGSLYFDTAVNNNGKWSNVEVNQTGYEIVQLNSSTIQLTSPVLTIDDARKHNVTRSYRCMVREAVNNCTERSKKYVRNEHVKIDYYPHNPENFSCQVYNWEKLTCTWDMIPYFHKADITVDCFWKNDLESGDRIWSSNFATKNFTSFTMDNFNMMPKYWFYFNITNIIRSIANNSAIFDINPYKIVKPAPVDFISFPNINDTCVTVVWSHSKQNRLIVFRVQYTSECSTEQQITTRKMNITVCDLNPYTNYTFVVDSRPVDLDSEGNSLDTVGFTSEPRDSLVTTMSAVPAANPKLLSYTDVQCPEKQCRKVLVYWKPLSPCDLHDSLSGPQYEIITNQIGSPKTENYTADSKALSYSMMLPDDSKVYEVKLRVKTGTGMMREDFSYLVIWPRKQSPIAPNMIVEYVTMKTGTQFYITLSLTEAQSQTSQILYWCHVVLGFECKEAMSFKNINGSSDEIFIGNYVMDSKIKFGVESLYHSSGEIIRSGIQMARCIYQKDKKPLIPPKNFHIAKGIAEREGELSLQWDPYDCNSPEPESGYVLSYTLYYCQVTDESACDFNHSMIDLNAISIERDIHNYTVNGLKPGGRYKVWLTARTSAGEGPPTDAIDTYIYLQEFPLWAKVMIGVGSLIASLVILICAVKFQHYLKSRRNAFSLIEVPDTRLPVMNGYDYVQIRLSNNITQNGHVIMDDESDEPIPDMDESEELSRIIPFVPNGNAQVSVTNNSSSNSLSLDLWQSDQMTKLLDMPFFGSDHKDYGHYISSNDMASTCSDIESDIDTKDEKKIKLGAFVLPNLLPEDYCRAVVNVDYVQNIETNPVIYEDRLDNKFLKMQGQAVHSQSIDSLLNDGSELQGPNSILLDDCKGNICERNEEIDSVCVKDSSNLPQGNVTTGKKIELGWMKCMDDYESDDLALSHDADDAADASSDDSLSLFDVIYRSLDKKTSGYVPVHEVHDNGEPMPKSTRHAGYSHLDEISLESDDGHARPKTAGVRSIMDNMKSENDLVRSDDDKIIPTDFVKCDDCTVTTNNNSVKAMGDPGRNGDNFENSCEDSMRTSVFPEIYDSPQVDDCDSTVIHHNQNTVQNGVSDNQQKVDMDTFLSQMKNNGHQIENHHLKKNSAMPCVSNIMRNGLVRLPLDTSLLRKVGKDGASRNGYQ